ncbi:MAG: hypothetical protein RIQ99_829 [Pseudomonadota bacterium]|jgi:uncharacterized oxidoreductase
MKLAGKTALVTGGTDGIGAHLIRQLRDQGVTVIVAGRDPERCAATRADDFEVLEADLASVAGVNALIAAVKDRAIDILVNNAGAGGTNHDYRTEAAPDIDVADRVIFLNLNAPIRLIAGLMDGLRARPEAMIVNVTSGLALAPRSGGPVYCASKAGLRSYTQALRAQLRGTSIHVLEALPPVVETKMTAGRGSRKMAPHECARQIVSAMRAGRAEANVGLVKLLRVVYSISPALVRRIMLRF